MKNLVITLLFLLCVASALFSQTRTVSPNKLYITQEFKASCEHLRNAVLQRKIKVHAFGHCHEGTGEENRNGIQFFNVAGNYKEITI